MSHTFTEQFNAGAYQMADYSATYGTLQQSAGFSQEDWDLLTDPECWSLSQQRKVHSVLAEAVSISMRVAGLQPTNLPGAYVAAVICRLVAPCNRLVAASRAPRSFDAMTASGIAGPSEVVETTPEQMMGLVCLFSEDFSGLDRFEPEDGVPVESSNTAEVTTV